MKEKSFDPKKDKNIEVGTAKINGKTYPAIFKDKKKKIWLPAFRKFVGWMAGLEDDKK